MGYTRTEIYLESDSPCGEVISKNLIFEVAGINRKFEIFKSKELPDRSQYLGYPLKATSGELVGVVGFIILEKFKHRYKNIQL